MSGTPNNRPWIAAIALLLAITGAAAQQGTFDDTTDVVVIEVPVHVTRNGEPLRGLTAENFELYSGRRREQLLDFQVIDLARMSAAESPRAIDLPVVARRHFLFLFDLSFARPAGIIKAQAAAQRLALEGLHPSDLVGVATYSEATGAQLLLGFTSDRRQLDLALATLGHLEPAERIRDPLGIVMADYKVYMEQHGGYQYDEQRQNPFGIALIPDAQWLNNMKDMAVMSGRANRDQVRNQILSLSSSLGELARHLATVDGRKHVVYFSEGFDSSSLLGTDDSKRLEELNKDASFGLVYRVDTDELFGDTGTQQGVFDMLEEFKRCDCTIQAVDIGGVEADGRIEPSVDGEQSLFVMADQTGGELYRNYNDLDQAMEAVLERTSVTYLLAFQPRELGEPGEFRPIRVKLEGAPRGARVIHRPGYYAPRPYAALDAEERRLETIELLMEGREGGAIEASVLAAPFKSTGGRGHVLTLIELEGYSLLRGHQGSVLPTEIFAYAVDEQGSVADFFAQAISLDLQKVRAELDNRGFKFVGHLELEPGSYEIRVLARNALTGATGIRREAVEVPEFGSAKAALLPPFFIEPEGSWLVGQQDPGTVDPLRVGDRRLIPAARPYLRAGVEVPVLLVGHRLDRGALEGRGRLWPADGSEPLETRLEVRRRTDTDVPGVERLAAVLGTGGAPAGEYRLEVTLHETATGRELSSTIPVRIY